MSEDSRARKVTQALNRLETRYGAQDSPASYAPLEAFLAAILMDSIPRSRAHEALEQLKKRFVDWNEARVSTGKEIAEYCHPVHVSESAGRNVQRALEKVYAECATLTLDEFKEKNAKEAREYLATFEGVSHAAVAYAMLYGLQKAAIPVTKPVLRVAERLGLVEDGCGAERAGRFLERVVPSARMATFFETFSMHADEVCQQKEPKCRRCATVRLCAFRRNAKSPVKVLSHRGPRAAAHTTPSAGRAKAKRSTTSVRSRKKRAAK